jgi:hypothetical protein
MVVGLHWREYTLIETIQLIEKMGFEAVMNYYFSEKGSLKPGILNTLLKKIFYSYPPFRPHLVVIGRKISVPKYDFWITEANS